MATIRQHVVRKHQSKPKNWIVAGDFNSHSPSWGFAELDKKGEEFEQWATDNCLILINQLDEQDPSKIRIQSLEENQHPRSSPCHRQPAQTHHPRSLWSIYRRDHPPHREHPV